MGNYCEILVLDAIWQQSASSSTYQWDNQTLILKKKSCQLFLMCILLDNVKKKPTQTLREIETDCCHTWESSHAVTIKLQC